MFSILEDVATGEKRCGIRKQRQAAVPDDARESADALGLHPKGLLDSLLPIAPHRRCRLRGRLCPSNLRILRHHHARLCPLHRPPHHPLNRYGKHLVMKSDKSVYRIVVIHVHLLGKTK